MVRALLLCWPLFLVLACDVAEAPDPTPDGKSARELRLYHRDHLPLRFSLQRDDQPDFVPLPGTQPPERSEEFLIETSPKLIQGRGDCMIFGTTHFFEYAWYLLFGERFDASQQYLAYRFTTAPWKIMATGHTGTALKTVALLNDGMVAEADHPYDQEAPWYDPPASRPMVQRRITFEPYLINDTGNRDWSEGAYTAEHIVEIKEDMVANHAPVLLSVTEWGGFIWHVMVVVGWDEAGLYLRDSLAVSDTSEHQVYREFFTRASYDEIVDLGIAAWSARFSERPARITDGLVYGLEEFKRNLLCLLLSNCPLDLALEDEAKTP